MANELKAKDVSTISNMYIAYAAMYVGIVIACACSHNRLKQQQINALYSLRCDVYWHSYSLYMLTDLSVSMHSIVQCGHAASMNSVHLHSLS
jgi:hypothetical protein